MDISKDTVAHAPSLAVWPSPARDRTIVTSSSSFSLRRKSSYGTVVLPPRFNSRANPDIARSLKIKLNEVGEKRTGNASASGGLSC